ncbi:MAG: ABC transporter substrate-binding protein [Thermoleophilia bacterium]|nr:ABC transporter substrate-binding protein [Thermoleophilia bacterium]
MTHRSTNLPARRGALASLTLAIALVLSACGGSSAAEEQGPDAGGSSVAQETDASSSGPQPGGELVLGFADSPVSLDPNAAFNNKTGYQVIVSVLEPLVLPTDDLGGVENRLAASVEPNADFTEWTITLRPGLTFSDGTALDAADVVFTLEQIKQDPGFAYLVGPLDQVAAVDDLTVRATCSAPYAAFPAEALASLNAGIVPESWGGKSKEDFFSHPVGAGPFVLDSYEPGSEIVLRRNDAYWEEGKPYLDRIVIEIVPDDNARVLGFEAGEFDAINRVPFDQRDRLGDAAVVTKPGAVTDGLYFNSANELLADPKIREAIRYAIDREAIASSVFGGLASVATGVIPVVLPNAVPGEIPLEYDLARAKQLVASSQHPQGGTLEVMVVAGDQRRNLEAQVIQEQLAEIGLSVEIRAFSFAEFFDRMTSGEHQASLYGYEAVIAPALDIVGYYAGTAGFFGGWETDEATAIYDQLSQTADDAEQQELIAQFETAVATDGAAVPTVDVAQLNARREHVQNLRILPTDLWRLDDVWRGE